MSYIVLYTGLSYNGITATDTTDFSGTTIVNVPDGVTIFTTMISLIDDNIAEIDETFYVWLESVGATGSPTDSVFLASDSAELTTTFTIEDDDTGIV